MKHFVRKHKKKIIIGHGIVTVLFLLSTTLLLSDDDAILFFTPYGSEILPLRETVDVDVNVTTKKPLNALGATIKYPKDTVEIVGVSKKKSFLDLWTEDIVIRSEKGEVVFSGGTVKTGGLLGTGTAFTLTLRALKPGEATLELLNAQALAGDGMGTQIQHEARSITFVIPETTISAGDGTEAHTNTLAPGDFDANGVISLSDASVLMVRLLMPYDAKYDLDANGSVGISDLSILLSKL